MSFRISSDTASPGRDNRLDSRGRESSKMRLQHSDKNLRFRARQLGFGLSELPLTPCFLETLFSDPKNASSWKNM